MDNKKKIVISSILIIAMIFLIIGITFAVFNFVSNASDNQIQTGSITMSYSEPSNALELINALPMSDSEGMNQTNYFEFNVSSNARTNADDDTGITIPYEVNISDLQVNEGMLELPKNAIKISLVKVEDGTEIQVIEKPTLLSDMSASSLRENATKIYNTENIHKNNNDTITTTYRLRAWIDENYSVNKESQEQYKFSINVNSNVSNLSILKIDRIMLEVLNDGVYKEITTITKDDKIRITFIYNNNIKGEVPVLTLKFGDKDATGSITNGKITDNKLSYEYTITESDVGKISIKDLTGGSIKDNSGNSAPILTSEEKESLNVIAEQKSTFSDTLLGKNNSNVVTSGAGLYKTTETNSGKAAYYYRGNVMNNYVSLPEQQGETTVNALYRIIRINDDGSIKIIRQNSTTNGHMTKNGADFTYMYYSNNRQTGNVPSLMTEWYTETLKKIDSKVVETEFCEQAKLTWYGNTTLKAGSATMIAATNDYKPTLKCSSNGYRGIYNSKVGLITMDEVVFAGIPLYTGSQTNNTSTYLQTGQSFWTMSPAGVNSSGSSYIWSVVSTGYLSNSPVNNEMPTRPVISLSADVVMNGKGTSTEPFELVLD